MNKFIITTDNTCDMPAGYYEEHGVRTLHLSCVIDDEVYDDINKKITMEEFYSKVRSGAKPITQQVNPEASRALFEELIKDGYDILHIAFSSGLSGTCNSAMIAAEELAEDYPDSKIIIIDSLCASAGEGLLLHECIERKKAGMDIDAIAKWANDNKTRIVHEILTNDLFHLHRGGRVKKSSAVIGSALNIKPLLRINREGKLEVYAKPRGRSNALVLLANNLCEQIDYNETTNTIVIAHGDAPNEAVELKELILAKYPNANIIMSWVGCVIGTHTGPGAITLFYLGKSL